MKAGRYKATKTVHCPNGPINACDKHAEQIKLLMNVLGAHVHVTDAPEGRCTNCINEAMLSPGTASAPRTSGCRSALPPKTHTFLKWMIYFGNVLFVTDPQGMN